MSVSAISRRYAKALVKLADEQNQVERFGDELAQFSSLLANQDLLRLLLESPTLPLERKKAVLDEVLAGVRPAEVIQNFFGLLLEKDRLQYLPQISAEYRRQADELSGIIRASVTSAAELGEQQKQAIGASLERQTGKKVELTVAVDPALIGGLQAQIGGRLFDGSLKTQLKRIEDTLQKG